MTKLKVYFLFPLFFYLSVQSQTLSKETVVIETNYGKIKLKLYEETPLHKSNFIKLVQSGFYDSLLFHRVIQNFMIQGGDQLSKRATAEDSLGHGDIGYTIPAEINEKLIHKKGTLCAARESDAINPKFESSASQFYLVQGKVRTLEDLAKIEDRIQKTRYVNAARKVMLSDEGKRLKKLYSEYKNSAKEDSALATNAKIEAMISDEMGENSAFKFSEYQTKVYTSEGGTPHLDGTYTVFGEITEGINVLEKIVSVKTDKRDRPLKDVRMKMYLVN